MKLAIVVQHLDKVLPPRPTSVGICTYGLARRLADRHEVVVYGIAHPPMAPGDMLKDGVRHRLMPRRLADRVLFKLGQHWALRTKALRGGRIEPRSTANLVYPLYHRAVAADIARNPVDAILVQHSTQPLGVLRALNPTTPLVLHLHKEWLPQSDKAAIRRRVRHADRISCVSDFSRSRVIRDFPELAERCVTVPNGIDPSDFAVLPAEPIAASGAPPRILFAADCSPEKGIHLLIEAMNRLQPDFPKARLEFLGEPRARPREELYADMGAEALAEIADLYKGDLVEALQRRMTPAVRAQVSFSGRVPHAELLARLGKAEVVVCPSICEESFGLPAIEAMAAGTPVIAARAGGFTETIADGVTGYLVERNDPKALTDALRRVLSDPASARSMAAAARAHVLDRFTWQRAAERFEDVIEPLVADRSSIAARQPADDREKIHEGAVPLAAPPRLSAVPTPQDR